MDGLGKFFTFVLRNEVVVEITTLALKFFMLSVKGTKIPRDAEPIHISVVP